MSKDKYLRVEIEKKHTTICIHGNKEGLQELLESIKSLLEGEHEFPSDVSMLSPQYGGDDLTEDEPSKDSDLIHHLRIYRWE